MTRVDDAEAKKIKLLMGIPHPAARGGPPTHLPMLVDYFRRHSKYEVRTFYYGSRLFGTERGHNETVLRKVFVTGATLLEYFRLLVTFRPNIVHLNTSFNSLTIMRDFPFAVFSRVFRKKLIFKIHGNDPRLFDTDSQIQLFLIRLIFWGATKIGVLSDPERKAYFEKFGHAEKILVVKNIVNVEDSSIAVKEDENQKSGTLGFFVSRVEKMKGLRDLIKAMRIVRKEIPDFRLIVAGDGPDMRNCVDLADQLNLSGYITWLGYIDNDAVQSLHRQCNVFIFPTYYPEGMPMVLVEALKSGIPVVTTEVWFCLSYLKNRTNCLYAARGNPDDLAHQIVNVCNDRRLQEVMRRENPQIVKQFSAAIVGQEFEDIYRDMLADV